MAGGDSAVHAAPQLVIAPSQLMKSDDDTVNRRLSILIPLSAIPTFLGVGLDNARPGTLGRTLHGEIRYAITDTPARNVVAILPGSDPKLKGQYVAIGAHSDTSARAGWPLDTDRCERSTSSTRTLRAREKERPGFPERHDSCRGAKIKISRKAHALRRQTRFELQWSRRRRAGSVGCSKSPKVRAQAKARSAQFISYWHTAKSRDFPDRSIHRHRRCRGVDRLRSLNIDMIGRGEATDMPAEEPSNTDADKAAFARVRRLIERSTPKERQLQARLSYEANGPRSSSTPQRSLRYAGRNSIGS